MKKGSPVAGALGRSGSSHRGYFLGNKPLLDLISLNSHQTCGLVSIIIRTQRRETLDRNLGQFLLDEAI
jgi:hypothetical protein